MYCFLAPCTVPPRSAFCFSRSRRRKLAYAVRAIASPVTVTHHGGVRPDLPRLLYLGGLDGAALPRAQVDSLQNCFDPVSICPSAEDRSGWDALAQAVAAVVGEEASDAGKPVVLVGESFGAALALRVAALDRGHGHIERLVIVNPGTALASETFLRSFTALLPLLRLDGSGTVLYRAAALILYKNFLVDEQRIRPDCIPGDGSWLARSVDIAAVPLEVMLHRVQLLRTFQDSFGDSCLARLVTVPTTIVASKHDRLFPSRKESERLAGLLPNVVARVILEHSAHACLLERDVSLIDLVYPDRSVARNVKDGPAFMKHAAFPNKRRSKGHVPKQPATSGESKSSKSLSAFQVRQSSEYKEDDMVSSKSCDAPVGHKIAEADTMLSDAAGLIALQNRTKTVTSSHMRDWNLDRSQKGTVADQNEPGMSFEEAFNLGQRFLTPWRTLIKPVFSGRHFVADAMKDHFESKRPVLFVGNHGVYGFLDTPIIIEELNNLIGGPRLRALAHDIHFDQFNKVTGGRWGPFCSALGAIRATPRNYYRLLRQGEPILLFPGGPTEVCRRRGQKNILYWSDDTEFVRPAARMNAVIVPFSCVGADDAVDIILDGQEMQRIPVLGPLLRQALVDNNLDPEHVMPLGTLQRLKPFQIEFHEPIRTLNVDPSDVDACRAVYKRIRLSVESGIARLLLAERNGRKLNDNRDGHASRFLSSRAGGLLEMLLHP